MMTTVRLKILIVDDESDARRIISKMVHRFFPNQHQIEEAINVADGVEKIRIYQPDLVFLDINLTDGSGFDLLDQMNGQFDFKLIFTTGFDEYALKGFKYCAIDYLLKPIDPDDLVQAMQKVMRLQEQVQIFELLKAYQKPTSFNSFEKLALPSAEGIIMVDLKKVLRLESDKGYTTFHLVNGKKYTISKCIGEYEAVLPKSDFYRIHVSHLINMNFVEKFLRTDGGIVLLDGGIELPIARRRKDGFLEQLKIATNPV